jgi:hypothetical protein
MSDPEISNQDESVTNDNASSMEPFSAPESKDLQGRRQFLRSLGKWSGAAIIAAIGGAWLSSKTQARAGGWINRRGGWGGGWINRGGGWINRAGWINRGGGWINRVGGGGGWINRRGGWGGSWINRR